MTRMASWGSMKQRGIATPSMGGAGSRGKVGGPSDGKPPESRAVPADSPVDCFYVYPTVSNQPTQNASQTPDPEVRSIAVFQAQRFSTRCRVYVPLYREATAAAVAIASQTHDTTAYENAFTDVLEAWR